MTSWWSEFEIQSQNLTERTAKSHKNPLRALDIRAVKPIEYLESNSYALTFDPILSLSQLEVKFLTDLFGNNSITNLQVTL
jgi:hypothetical protein